MTTYEMIEQSIKKFNKEYFLNIDFIKKAKMINIYIEYEELKQNQHYESLILMDKLCDNDDNYINKMIKKLFNEINDVIFVDTQAAYDAYLNFIKTAIKYEKLKLNKLLNGEVINGIQN